MEAKSNNRTVLDYLYKAGPCTLGQMKQGLAGEIDPLLISAILSRYRNDSRVRKDREEWDLLPGTRRELTREMESPAQVVSPHTVNIWTPPMTGYEARIRAAMRSA